MKKRLTDFLRKTAGILLNPRLLLCFGIAWLITNGWAYLAVILGTLFHIKWLTGIGTGYLAIIWMPFTPEKASTTALAFLFMKFIFPKDQRTLSRLNQTRKKKQKKRHKKPDKSQ